MTGQGFELRPETASDLSPIVLRVIAPPVPFPADDEMTHLVYELLITNFRAEPIEITGVQVLDDDTSDVLLDLAGEAVAANMTAIHDPADTAELAGGETGIVYLDVTLAPEATVPAVLAHEVSGVEIASGEDVASVVGARTEVDLTTIPPVIGAPLGEGTWVAAEACCDRSHHRRGPANFNGTIFLAQRYAMDFIRIEDGLLWEGDDPKDLDSWFTYGEPALAVADATVVSVLDGEPDITPFEPNPSPITKDNVTGNHVMLDLGGGFYLIYAHLQPGSIEVEVGDTVTKGQTLGLVGNSGNTDAPHLHVHVTDALDVIQSNGVPFLYDAFTLHGSFESLDALLPEPFGEVGPEEPDLLAEPEDRADEYTLELSIVSWPSG